ncbi:MAG: substrate-binding domain-containing protein [Thermodesulfobacteriota bacterium]
MKKCSLGLLVILLTLFIAAATATALDKTLKMSTTTSTEASGLLDVLLPALEKGTGIQVKVFAKGTGAAIRDGMDGNVDVIFVHDREREDQFVAEGYGTKRYAVMHNDFVITGPPKDPAGIKGLKDAAAALKKIAAAKVLFISRGDDSGTHGKEQALWKSSGVPTNTQRVEVISGGKKQTISFIVPQGSEKWYLSIGQGMGKTITFADEKQAYTLADRGTYISSKYGKDAKLELEILCEGGDDLANPYGVVPVNPKKFPHVKYDLAEQFAQWLVSAKGQSVIAGYQVLGKQLFFPDAVK